MRRLIWLGILALGGGGIFYAVHPRAKDCEAVIRTANVAVDAGNRYQQGQPVAPLIGVFSSTATKLNSLATGLHEPFRDDATTAAGLLQNMADDLESGDFSDLPNAIDAYNSEVQTTNADCRGASGNVDG